MSKNVLACKALTRQNLGGLTRNIGTKRQLADLSYAQLSTYFKSLSRILPSSVTDSAKNALLQAMPRRGSYVLEQNKWSNALAYK